MKLSKILRICQEYCHLEIVNRQIFSQYWNDFIPEDVNGLVEVQLCNFTIFRVTIEPIWMYGSENMDYEKNDRAAPRWNLYLAFNES